jgi:hypothetical protein
VAITASGKKRGDHILNRIEPTTQRRENVRSLKSLFARSHMIIQAVIEFSCIHDLL